MRPRNLKLSPRRWQLIFIVPHVSSLHLSFFTLCLSVSVPPLALSLARTLIFAAGVAMMSSPHTHSLQYADTVLILLCATTPPPQHLSHPGHL
ncbi:hypothetical protein V9T40_010404 [Parthenolecanium corni]|uniref:Uncharacterized protein n=1 Tax=Parthenolecanium corni TaxID=536013 RepID=A0AAN9Y052_9HEMI